MPVTMPMLPLRGVMVFPYMILSFEVGRDSSIAAVEEALMHDSPIFLATQLDLHVENPAQEDLYGVGVVSRIKQVMREPGQNMRVLAEGLYRAELREMEWADGLYLGHVEPAPDKDEEPSAEQQAYMRMAVDAAAAFAEVSDRIPKETTATLEGIARAGQLADVIAAHVIVGMEDKQRVLATFDPGERLERVLSILRRETEIGKVQHRVNGRVKLQMDRNQREYFLHEQLKAIQKELGENDEEEYSQLRKLILDKPMGDEAREKALKELARLEKMAPGTPEIAVIRSYLEWLTELPWGVYTQDRQDIKRAAAILDEDHYGLEKVKERILEYLAVLQLTGQMQGPILCFVGPPGVGKTSIARSIARAVDRKFMRMSLGGVRDEAEIRGHRRTYIGAIPGRIITGLRQAGSMNPVILLDEIDKMAADVRGDPASALLEVLDSEQNYAFRDHYLDVPFDLSNAMFLTTANTIEGIPAPLLDRMEIIRIEGYTLPEKLGIAREHLVPRQAEQHGVRGVVSVPEDTVAAIVDAYTREAGVRSLERQIAAICRKAARLTIEGQKKRVRVTPKNLEKFLGVAPYRREDMREQDQVGVATGLAWTSVGGETLSIEALRMPGTGKVELTGQLGDVMKESARAALSLTRARAERWGINPAFVKDSDVHIHVPEGAIPKDGPSAGITMTTAIVSALTGIPVRRDVAMTGEVTLTGRVLPIGGLKEKSLAAQRMGVRTVLYPAENRRELSEVPEAVREGLTFVPVTDVDEVLVRALTRMPGGDEHGNPYGSFRHQRAG